MNNFADYLETVRNELLDFQNEADDFQASVIDDLVREINVVLTIERDAK